MASNRSSELVAEICRALTQLALSEDDVAAAEACRTPYWAPCPASIAGHRAAARVLRSEAHRLERESTSTASPNLTLAYSVRNI